MTLFHCHHPSQFLFTIDGTSTFLRSTRQSLRPSAAKDVDSKKTHAASSSASWTTTTALNRETTEIAREISALQLGSGLRCYASVNAGSKPILPAESASNGQPYCAGRRGLYRRSEC